MGKFKTGDTVKVVNSQGEPERKYFVGKTAKVIDDVYGSGYTYLLDLDDNWLWSEDELEKVVEPQKVDIKKMPSRNTKVLVNRIASKESDAVYLIVSNEGANRTEVARYIKEGYTIELVTVAGDSVHYVLVK